LKLIPVIDLLNSIVVHAVAGKRDEYLPVKSILCKSPSPTEVATAFKSKLGFKDLYIADLTAILGGKPSFDTIRGVKEETNLRLLVDVGIKSLRTASRIIDCGVSKVIIGTETMADLSLVREVVGMLGKEKVVVSIDMKEDRILSRSTTIRSTSPLKLAKTLEGLGVNRIILLDLAKVGRKGGANINVIEEVLPEVAMEVIVGGGIHSVEELKKLRRLGVSGALLATALHTGEISKDILEAEGFLKAEG